MQGAPRPPEEEPPSAVWRSMATALRSRLRLHQGGRPHQRWRGPHSCVLLQTGALAGPERGPHP
eukprot:8428813-Alexandrium_andersonii.AAC.1